MRTYIFMTLLALTATSFGGASAFAQNNDLTQRMQRMERDITTLSRAVYKGDLSEKPRIATSTDQQLESSYSISIENRLGAIENQMQQLTGKIEELNFRLNKINSGTAMQNGSAALSPQQVPPGLAYNQPVKTSPLTISSAPLDASNNMTGNTVSNVTGNAASTPPPSIHSEQPNLNSALSFGTSDTKDYERAFSALKDGNYPAAQDGFKAFLETYKDSALTPNALYWLGETYYVQKQYGESARVFAQGYQSHPDSNKTNDNLLKLGLSLAGMGKKDDACIALLQLVKKNTSETPVLSRAKQEAKKLGCAS
jgi:tol-pal system protein YbgF